MKLSWPIAKALAPITYPLTPDEFVSGLINPLASTHRLLAGDAAGNQSTDFSESAAVTDLLVAQPELDASPAGSPTAASGGESALGALSHQISSDQTLASPSVTDPALDQAPRIHFATAGVKLDSENDESILETAERNGLSPKFGCRRGVCRRCIVPLESGCTFNERDQSIAEAGTHVKICVSRPLSDISVDI